MRANPHTTPGTTNGGRISWVPYVWACAIRQTPSSTAISDAIRHIARVRTYATCGIPYRLTSSPGHLTGYACQGIHDWTEPQQPASHQAHTRQITHVTAYTTRKKSPPSNPSYVPSASPRTPRHTQPDRTTTTPPSGISIRHATHATAYTTRGIPRPIVSNPRHSTSYACPDIHNQTEGAEQLQNLPAPGGSRMPRHTQHHTDGIHGLPGADFRHAYGRNGYGDRHAANRKRLPTRLRPQLLREWSATTADRYAPTAAESSRRIRPEHPERDAPPRPAHVCRQTLPPAPRRAEAGPPHASPKLPTRPRPARHTAH
ncbi:hypothetical protein CQR47_0147 [Bifidobacterium thermophilum]|uniref:Uncharacterized protein n=1 Tax=Bifidobacterium thermophilum TaxID=33905 RepID=A0A2N3QNX2_9BIFI|nr:hypothetical protein CQR47_0147 [Bifidobacterium thermophilum]